jgi:hypothetical protein
MKFVKYAFLFSAILLCSLLTVFAGDVFHHLPQASVKNTFCQRYFVPGDSSLKVHKCTDFEISGKGNDPEWNKAEWSALGKKVDEGGKNYKSKFKVMYSGKGLYLLFGGEDDKITTHDYKDYEEIYEGDVYEVFFHPDPSVPIYFEYEINHLEKELILTLTRSKGQNLAWAPWDYEYKKNKLIVKKVNVTGGPQKVNSSIKYWTAEIFFPYTVFGLLPQSPPKSGTVWNANFCRIDYDSGKMIQWSWSPKIERDFHELNNFGSIVFE